MTGRDLIIYILKNGLENKPVFENGRFIGLSTVEETAERMGVGIATVYAWMHYDRLDWVAIGDAIYIPENAKVKGLLGNEK